MLMPSLTLRNTRSLQVNKHIELKPCPFCGESDDIYLFDTDRLLVSKVRCDGCGAFAPAESWNDREKDMTGTGSNVNKHIELVKKWLKDKSSVNQAELEQARDEAEREYRIAKAVYNCLHYASGTSDSVWYHREIDSSRLIAQYEELTERG